MKTGERYVSFLTVFFALLIIRIQSMGDLGGAGGGGAGGGGAGGGGAGITITPPPAPQEILPPKPIIVAPLLIKQHSKKNKLAVINSGMPLSYGMDSPHVLNNYGMSPGPYIGPRALKTGMVPPMMGMMPQVDPRALQNVYFNNVHQPVPYLDNKLVITHNKQELLPNKLKNDYVAEASNQNILMFDKTMNEFNELNDDLNELEESVKSLKTKADTINNSIEAKIGLLAEIHAKTHSSFLI